MRNKQQPLKLILVGAGICGFPGAAAWACSVSVPSELSVNSPSEVLLVDGADRNSSVTIKAWLDTPNRSEFDFGFMNQGAYVPITGKSHTKGTYTFAGGSIVDFALRYSGPDGLFGTPDDQIYRLSDSAGYAREHYVETIRAAKSRHPKVSQSYYRDLRLSWDLNLDGKPDAYTWLEFKSGRYDGMLPAATAVPLPGTLLFFGSGLLGLAATLRGGRRA